MKTKLFEIEVYQHKRGKWDWEMHSGLTGTHYGFSSYPSYDEAAHAAMSYCEWAYYSFNVKPKIGFDINAECNIRKVKRIGERGVTVTIEK